MGQAPAGLILAGIVGCGKTTAVEAALERLATRFAIFKFTGDDVGFRTEVAKSGRYLLDHVRSATQRPALVFVDEVQKSEAVFDALKLCFDHGISFIVSGSNPQYLSSTCRARLQRRADFIRLYPVSLPEILQQQGHVKNGGNRAIFADLLDKQTDFFVPDLGLHLGSSLPQTCQRYLIRGGLPLAHLAETEEQSLRQIQMVVERGFDVMSHDNADVSDIVRCYLAAAHSREFAYQGLFQRTGIRSRNVINAIIEELMGHGYLVLKKPIFPGLNRKSYLGSYSYIDPGIVSYLVGDTEPEQEQLGFRVEGMIHARLENLMQFIPLKTHLAYFKPFTVDQNDKTKFLPGEVDFVYERGRRLIPIEAKLTSEIAKIDTTMVESFVRKYKSPYGIILYGGVPQARSDRKLIYWPYWLI